MGALKQMSAMIIVSIKFVGAGSIPAPSLGGDGTRSYRAGQTRIMAQMSVTEELL